MEFLIEVYEIFIKYYPSFIYGAKFTLQIAITSTIFGVIIGLFIGALRANKIEPTDSSLTKFSKKLIHLITSIYVEVYRGTPMMVQAVFIYYALKPVLNWSPITAGIFIVSINTGAYMTEIIRSGIQSVDKGQTEAARSLGMSSLQTLFYVVLPQAFKNAFPSIGNEFIVNIKDSSVLNVISVTELFFQSNSVAGSIFKYKETFFVTAIIYLVLTFTTSRILNLIEKKMYHKKTSYPASQTMDTTIHLTTSEVK